MKKLLFLIALVCMSAASVSAQAKGEIVVKTASEFIHALGPDRTIVIDSKSPLNITPVVEQELQQGGVPRYDYYNSESIRGGIAWYDNFDGAALVMKGFKNLTIRGRGNATIVSEPRYANVLMFDDCPGLTLDNVVLGHTMDGYCEAGVVELRGCSNVKIDGCNLYGCGTEAMIVDGCLYVDVTNTEMHHCTYHTMHVKNSAHVRFKDCNMHDNKEFEQINVSASRDVWFEDCRFTNLQGTFFAGDTTVPFYGCTFTRCQNSEADGNTLLLPRRTYTGRTWQRWVQITGRGVNMRMGPSTEAGKQGGTLVKGEYAPVLEETDEWVKIYTPHHLFGYAWVSKQYAPAVSAAAVPEYVRHRCVHDQLVACGDDLVADDPELFFRGEISNGSRQFFFCAMDGNRQLNGIVCRLTEIPGEPDAYRFAGRDRFNGYDDGYEGTIRFEAMKDGRIKARIKQEILEGEDPYRLPKEMTLRPLSREEAEARRDEIDRQALEGRLDDVIRSWSGTWRSREDGGMVTMELNPGSLRGEWGHVYIGDGQYDDRHDIVRHYGYSVPDKQHITFMLETVCSRELDSKVWFRMTYNYNTMLMTVEIDKMELSHEGAGCMFFLNSGRKKWTFGQVFE